MPLGLGATKIWNPKAKVRLKRILIFVCQNVRKLLYEAYYKNKYKMLMFSGKNRGPYVFNTGKKLQFELQNCAHGANSHKNTKKEEEKKKKKRHILVKKNRKKKRRRKKKLKIYNPLLPILGITVTCFKCC